MKMIKQSLYFLLILPFVSIFRFLIMPFFGLKWNNLISKQIRIAGGYFYPTDFLLLSKNKVDVIINMATEIPFPKYLKTKYKYYEYDIPDGGNPPLEYLDEISNIISKSVKQGLTVQVNCALGASRSALAVLYYYLKVGKFNNYNDVFSFINKKRKQIGFNKTQKQYIDILIEGLNKKNTY